MWFGIITLFTLRTSPLYNIIFNFALVIFLEVGDMSVDTKKKKRKEK